MQGLRILRLIANIVRQSLEFPFSRVLMSVTEWAIIVPVPRNRLCLHFLASGWITVAKIRNCGTVFADFHARLLT